MTRYTDAKRGNRSVLKRFERELAKIMTVVLCLSMLCVYLPVTARAEEEEDEYVIPETEDIAQVEAAPAEGTVIIAENVESQNVNALENLLKEGEDEENLTFVNDFPVVVQTQVFDNSGVTHQSFHSPYEENQQPGTGGQGGNNTHGSGSTTVSELYVPKPDAVPVSNEIVIKGTTESITPPEEVQEELAKEEFSSLQRQDNNTPQDTTDDTFIRTRETTSDNAINKAVQEALARATPDSEYITIVVGAGEYNGDIIIDATGDVANNLDDGFKLYILAEDSYTAPAEGEIIDKASVGSQGEGVATVDGNVQVNAAKNFELIMAGLYFSINSLVEAKGNASVTIHGTQDDDTVTYTSSGSGETKISTGEGDDTVNVTLEGTGDHEISTGEGTDNVAIELSGNKEVEVTLNGGEGDDTVSVSAAEASGQNASVTLNMGSGADSINVDLNTANAVSSLNVSGDEDYDVLTLSGEINSSYNNKVTEEAIRVGEVVVDYNFVIEAASKAGKVITINAAKINALADGLEGKSTTVITENDITESGDIVVSGSFTDYVLSGNLLNSDSLTLRAGEDAKLYFAKLEISGDELELGSMDITGLDLEINGKQITINGNISADSIIINASDDDSYALSQEGSLGTSSMKDTNTDIDLDFWNFDFETNALIRVAQGAALNAKNNIFLSASSVQTQPIFNFDLGSLVDISFPLVVKVGLAEIGIDGSLTAGGRVEAESSTRINVKTNNNLYQQFRLPLSVVIVTADANTDVSNTGVITSGSSTKLSSKAEVTTSSVATIGMIPVALALSVVSVDAGTTVDGVITSGGNIDLLADAYSNVTTISQEDPPTEMLTIHNGTGNAGTVVKPPAPPQNGSFSFGGFFAVAVVLQDCRALVTEAAQLTAGTDININSKSIEKARTLAQASMKGANGQQQAMDLNSITGMMTGILGMVQENPNNQVLSYLGMNKLMSLLGKGIDQIKGGDLKINTGKAINGTVTAPVKANKGDTVTVRAVPDSGYTIDTAIIGYTDQATGRFVSVVAVPAAGEGRPTSTDFTFVMPDASVELAVAFRKLNSGEKALTLGTGEIDSRAGVEGSANTASGSGTDSFKAPEYPKEKKAGDKDVFEITATPVEKVSSTGQNGATTQIVPGTVSINTKYAKNGQQVLVDLKPADGYEVEKLVIVKTMDGRSVTEEVHADDNGQYIFTMIAADAKVTATFRKKTAATSQTQSSDMGTTGAARKNSGQLVGSVAVAFVKNNNKADITLGDTFTDANGIVRNCFVTAGGTVALDADASTQSESLADASPIDRDPKASTHIYVNDGGASVQDQVTAEKVKRYGADEQHPEVTVVFNQMLNGSSSDERYSNNKNQSGGNNQKITFNLAAREGYYINKVWYTYVTETASGTVTEKVSSDILLYQFASDNQKVTQQSFTLMDQPDPSNPTAPSIFAKGKIYVYAEYAPNYYTITRPAAPAGKTQTEYSYQISGGSGTNSDGNAQARSGSTVVIHTIKKGNLNSATGKLDYNEAMTSDDIKLVVSYMENGVSKNLDVTLNSTGGFSFVMPAHNVSLKFESKSVKLDIFDATTGSENAVVNSLNSDLSIGEYYSVTDANGNAQQHARVTGTADSKDRVVLHLSQKAYDNGKKITITVEAYGHLTSGNQTTEQKLNLEIPVTNDGNGIYSFYLPDLTNGKEFEQAGSTDKLNLVGLRIKYAFGAEKDYKISATATTKPRVTSTTNGTPNPTPTPTPNPQAKPNVAETTGGVISVAPAADLGENIYVTVTPYTGYRLVSNSLKITFKFTDGTEQTYTLGLDGNGVYKYTLAKDLPAGKTLIAYNEATKATPITITGQFASDAGGTRTSDAKTFSAGVGVDVAITKHTNEATISRGVINADGIVLAAKTPEEISSSATSLAGYSAGDFGVAGAITVHVASAKTYAQIKKDAVITIGSGDLVLDAKSKTNFNTIAEGSNPNGAEGAKAGVGAGIAVAVIGVDSVAELCEGVNLTQTADAQLKKLEVTAESRNTEIMNTKAGSAGGISITPVLALVISAVTNEAILGRSHKNNLINAMNGTILANSFIDRQVAANASAVGGNVGLGGSFAITVLNDTTRAKINNSYKGDNLKISTTGRSNLRSTSRAGAKGAPPSDNSSAGSDGSGSPPSGSSDAQANNAIGKASNLANTGNRGLSGNKVQTMADTRTNADTEDETSVQIAAGFNLNVQENINESVIADGIILDLSGKLEVSAYNDTDAAVYANASAVGSDIGVGVAVAINIVDSVNRAVIGQASVKADSIQLVAEMYDDGSYEKMLAVAAQKADKDINIFEFLVRSAVTGIIDGIFGSLDPASNSILEGLENFVADLVASTTAQFIQTMLTHAGLEKLVSNDIVTKTKNFFDSFGEKLSDAAMNTLKNVLVTYLLNRLTSLGSAPLQAATNKLTGTVNIPGATKPNNSAANGTNTNTNTTGTTSTGAVQSIINKLSTEQKDTLKDVGALSLAALENFANQMLSDFINISQLKTFINAGFGQNIKASFINALNSAGKAATDVVLGSLSDAIDAQVVPAQEYPTHTFRTHAVSGAGASDVGVAGSLAIAVIDIQTMACIMDAEKVEESEEVKDITVTNGLVIRAQSKQYEDTIATAAVNGNGEADPNPAGGNTPPATTTGPVNPATNWDNGIVTVSETTNGIVNKVDVVRGADNKPTYTLVITPNANFKVGKVTYTITTPAATPNGQATTSTPVEVTFTNSQYKFTLDQAIPVSGTGAAPGTTVTINVTFSKILDPKLEIEGTVVTQGTGGNQGSGSNAGGNQGTGGTTAPTLTTYKTTGATFTVEKAATSTNAQGKSVDTQVNAVSGETIKPGTKITVKIKPEVSAAANGGAATTYYVDYILLTYTAPGNITKEVKVKTKEAAATNKKANTQQNVLNTVAAETYSFLVPEINQDGIDANAKVTMKVVMTTTAPISPVNPGAVTKAPQTEAGTTVGMGGSFAFNYVNRSEHAQTVAAIGKNRVISTGTLSMVSMLQNDLKTNAVAGSDPLAVGNSSVTEDKIMDVGLDAAVAIGFIDNKVYTYIAEGSTVDAKKSNLDIGGFDEESYRATLSKDLTEKEIQQMVDQAKQQELVSVYMMSQQEGHTLASAGAFSAGGKAAVGACAAVNYADSDVETRMAGSITAAGRAKIASRTYNTDDAFGTASAMGADIQRYLDRINDGTATAEGIANGDYNLADNPHAQSSSTKAISNAGGLTTPGVPDAANQQNPNIPGGSTGGAGIADEGNGTQIAAAVGINITKHKAHALVSGSLTAQDVMLHAENNANFRSRANAATVTLSASPFAVAAGVAISVNNNEAVAENSGTIITAPETNGNAEPAQEDVPRDIVISAVHTANMDGIYRGTLGAQALAGSVTGADSKATISGAFSILTSKALTKASAAKGSVIKSGGDLEITATDKTKLAVRAGGISYSEGTSVGVGASFALIYAENQVLALIEDGAKTVICAGDLKVNAIKHKVSNSDFALSLDKSLIMTDTTGLTPEQEAAAKKGILNINKGADGKYDVSINMSTEKLIDAIDLLNFLSSVNYYAEAIGGAIVPPAGSATATLAGSFAMLFYGNEVKAYIGKLENADDVITVGGNAEVLAKNDTNARLIAGSLNVSPAKVGVGLTVGAIANGVGTTDITSAETAGKLSVGGSFMQKAENDVDYLSITVAGSVAEGSGNSVGGAVNVIDMQNHVKSVVTGQITTENDLDILAVNNAKLLIIPLAIAVGMGGSVAAGVTISVIVTNTHTLTETGDLAVLVSKKGSVSVEALTDEGLIAITTTGAATAGTAAVGATFAVLVSNSRTEAAVNGSNIQAKQDILVRAAGDSWTLTAVIAATASSNSAVSGSVAVSIFQRYVGAKVTGDAELTAENGVILVEAMGDDFFVNVIVAAGGSNNAAISGSIPVVVSSSTVEAIVDGGFGTGNQAKLTAGDSIGVIADLTGKSYMAAGALSVSSNAAIGATIDTAVYQNVVIASVDNAVLKANCQHTSSREITIPNRQGRRRGVVVSATADNSIMTFAVSGGVGSNAAVTGVVNTLVVENQVKALMGRREEALENGQNTEDGEEAYVSVTSGGGILVQAEDESDLVDAAGALAVGSSAGVGATVVTLVYNKTVEAKMDARYAQAAGDVSVFANSDDDVFLLAISFGASGSAAVAGNVNVLVFNSSIEAAIGSVHSAKSVTVHADSNANLYNIS
ncbi:MAG: hypothetical protein IKY96_03105, partial [Oscillospiraceae bacterium]|nr:hypothetical protein [Oscillospiraceae bacterium]